MIAIVVALIVSAVVVYYLSTKQNEEVTVQIPQQVATTEPTAEANPESASDTGTLKAGGSSFSDPEGVYTFLYPNDFTLDTQDKNFTRIYKRGEQERPQSEMTDGVLMVFETVELQDQTLKEYVDATIEEQTADGTREVTEPQKAIKIKDYAGYTYEMRGLGTSTYVVLQKDTKSKFAVAITYSVSDPKEKDYQGEVDAILSTLELRK